MNDNIRIFLTNNRNLNTSLDLNASLVNLCLDNLLTNDTYELDSISMIQKGLISIGYFLDGNIDLIIELKELIISSTDLLKLITKVNTIDGINLTSYYFEVKIDKIKTFQTKFKQFIDELRYLKLQG